MQFLFIIEKSFKIFIFPLARHTRVLIYYALVRPQGPNTCRAEARKSVGRVAL